MKLSALELWEVASRKAVRSEPTVDWVKRGRNVLLNFSSDEIFEPFGGMRALASEAHALGWLHQAVQESARKNSFQQHTKNETKHLDTFTTTQIFTPRWVADFLCHTAIGEETSSVHDPTCGTGQMLLAAYDSLRDFGHSPQEVLGIISGADIDPLAIDVARDVLTIRVRQEDNFPGLRKRVDRTFAVRDVLDGIEDADVMITNPPFMGRRSMPNDLKERVVGWHPYDLDLFSVVIRLCQSSAKTTVAIVAPQVFWFLQRFEKARLDFLKWGTLDSFCLLGERTFRTLSGSKSNAAAFVQTKGRVGDTRCYDVRALDPNGKRERLQIDDPIVISTDSMKMLPGFPMAFWLPQSLVAAFDRFEPLGAWAEIPGGQNKTGDNATFLRVASEIEPTDIRTTSAYPSATGGASAQWVIYSKGGRFAPWWGNWHWCVDWSQTAKEFYADNPTSNLLAERFWFRPGLCYSDFGSVGFAARLLPKGCVFDMTGPAIFVPQDDDDLRFGLMAVLNSTAVRDILAALNPSLHTQVKNVRDVPVPSITTIRTFAEPAREITSMVKHEDPRFMEHVESLDSKISALYGVEAAQRQPLHWAFDPQN